MFQRFIYIFLIFSAFTLTHSYHHLACAQETQYEKFEQTLNEYIDSDGLVLYAELIKNRAPLDQFIADQIENRDISTLSKKAQKAFWINAYNALTLRLILDHYPLKLGGIRTINWGRPWSVKMQITGKTLTLNHIEHEILRKWDPIDPRIHFAINCASGGCPQMPTTIFNADNLDQLLDEAAIKFINNPQKVRLNRQKNILYHSAIFNWFKEDFLATEASIYDYILKYINKEDRAYLLDHKANIKLKELKYDWSLNESHSTLKQAQPPN